MALLTRVVEERTDLTPGDVDVLARVTQEWSLLSDLSLSDLVLWVPTWNDAGLIAVAQVRPTTAPTSVPDDVLGTFAPRGRQPAIDQAAAFGRPVTLRDIQFPRARMLSAPCGASVMPATSWARRSPSSRPGCRIGPAPSTRPCPR